MTKLPAYFSVGSGPAVVLLHSTLSSKNQWKSLSAMLEGKFRVIAPDLYGYGDTPMPEQRDNYTLLDEAELLRSLLDRLLPPDEPIHLVGHSFGGAVALRFCHLYRKRVKTLTVFEPVSFHLLDQDDPALAPMLEMMQELTSLLAAGSPEKAAATFLDYWNGAGCFDNFPLRIRKDFASRTDKLALDFTALTRTPLTLADFRELRLPVTLIAGRSSRLPALRVAQRLSETLPNCTLKWVETGHMGPVTDPELVNPVILSSIG